MKNLIKKISLCCIVLACLLCLFGCDTFDKIEAIKEAQTKTSTTQSPQQGGEIAPNPVQSVENNPHHVVPGYYYNQLGDDLKTAYVNIVDGIDVHLKSITVDLYMTEEQIAEVYTAICYDNPTFVCLTGTYGYAITEKSVIIEPVYSLSGEKCHEMNEEISLKIQQAVNLVAPYSSDYEKELVLHDWLVNNCSNTKIQSKKKNAYDALVLGTSDSYGYARAMQLLLNNVGITNHLVVGTYKNEGEVQHMWNVVEIDGNNYHLDVSLNDPIKTTKELLKHFYFNVTDEQINVDHLDYTPAVNNCISNAANYFVKENLVFSTYDDQTKSFLKDKIIETAKNHEYFIEICFDSDDAYVEGKKQMVDYNGVYKIVKEVNSQLSAENKLSLDMLYWEYSEKYRVVRFELTYVNDEVAE